MDLHIEADHPLKPALDRWAARLPDGLHLKFWYTQVAELWPCNIRLEVTANSEADANSVTQSFLDIVAGGRRALIRAHDEASSDTDFETGRRWWARYLRLAVFDEAGAHEQPLPPSGGEATIYGFGAPGS